MDRSVDSRPNYGYGSAFPRPPWERRDIPQVPYIGPTSPKPTELSGYSSSRPTFPNHGGSTHRVTLSSDSAKSTPSPPPYLSPSLSPEPAEYRRPSNAQYYQQQHQTHHQYLRDQSIHQEATYQAQPAATPPPNVTSPRGTFVPDRAPPTPPESIASGKPSPPGYGPTAPMALPGTMSSRERTPSRTRTRSERRAVRKPLSPQRPSLASADKSKSEPLGKRFKSAFRDIFKREPVDESQFEKIQDRHWTDDY